MGWEYDTVIYGKKRTDPAEAKSVLSRELRRDRIDQRALSSSCSETTVSLQTEHQVRIPQVLRSKKAASPVCSMTSWMFVRFRDAVELEQRSLT